MPRFSLLIATLISLGFCRHALAQDQHPEADAMGDSVVQLTPLTINARNDAELPMASSATKTSAPLLDIPQSVGVVSRHIFSLQDAHSLEDVLTNVASVSPSVGDGQRDQVYIRGFSAQFDQYLDGIRDEAMYFRDLSNIDRIEVLEGPSSVLYGHGSAGGLVNRITRQPTDTAEGSLSATFGSWNQKRMELDAGGPLLLPSLDYRLDAAGETSDGFRDQYFLQRYHLSPSMAWKPSSSSRILFQFDYLNDLRLDDLGIPALVGPPGSGFPGIAPAVPIDTYYGEPHSFDTDYVRAGVATGTVTVDHWFDSTCSLHDSLRLEHATLDRNNLLPTGVFLPGGGSFNGDLDAVWVTRSQRQILRSENDLFNQLEMPVNIATAGVEQHLLAGLELGRQSAASHSAQYNAPPVALLDPALTSVPAGAAPASLSISRVRADTAGVYLQDQLTFSAHWKALVGVRLDDYSLSQRNLLAPFNLLESGSHTLSPRIGLVYEPLPSWSVYGTVGRSFSPAGGDGLSIAANAAALAPLETVNYEAGLKKNFCDGSLSASAAVFQMTRNITETDPLTNLTSAAGQQRSRGLDLALTGRVNRRWEISASCELLDPEIVNGGRDGASLLLNGRRPGLVPRHNASIYCAFDLGHGFGIGAGAVAMGGRYTSNDDSVSIAAFTLFNAAVSYEHGRWEARLNGKNLLNRRYFASAGEGTDYSGQTLMPGAPINISGSVVWHL